MRYSPSRCIIQNWSCWSINPPGICCPYSEAFCCAPRLPYDYWEGLEWCAAVRLIRQRTCCVLQENSEGFSILTWEDSLPAESFFFAPTSPCFAFVAFSPSVCAIERKWAKVIELEWKTRRALLFVAKLSLGGKHAPRDTCEDTLSVARHIPRIQACS